MKLSIIIVSYNTKQLTLECLESVVSDLQSNKQLTKETEIIVIDNNSSDDSVKEIRSLLRKTEVRYLLIENKENVGFARANNKAVSRSRGKYVFFLNSDTIVRKGAISQLINAFETNPINEETAQSSTRNQPFDRLGLVAAQLLNTDGSIQAQGGSLPNLATLFFHMTLLDDLPLIGALLQSTQHTGLRATTTQKSGLQPMGWVGATALLARRSMLNEIGVFDETIFMYGEDVELCMRAQGHHWDVAISLEAEVTHLGSASSSSHRALVGELLSYRYIFSKHKPAWQTRLAVLFLQLGCILRIVIFGTINPQRAKPYKEALVKLRHS